MWIRLVRKKNYKINSLQDAETALKKFSAVRVLADVFPVTYAMTEKAEVNKNITDWQI